MKTTLDIPDDLLRRMKAHAAQEGRSMRAFTIEAIQRQLNNADSGAATWQRFVGSVDAEDRRRIDAAIEATCEQIRDSNWA